jgi:hypothetical protein
MLTRIFQSGQFAQRIRRSAREILLAIILTLAAAAFVFTAVYSVGSKTAAVDADEKLTSTPN